MEMAVTDQLRSRSTGCAGRAPRMPRLVAALAGVLACVVGSIPAAGQASPEPHASARFGAVSDFTFTERSGEQVSLADLKGQVWIGVPFFRGCTGPCPSLTSDLHTAFKDKLEGKGVRIVSFTLDAEADTTEALNEYAATYKIEGDDWLFLTGPDKAALQEFVRSGLKVPVAESAGEGIEYGESITHGTRLPVVDAEGHIAGWYEAARVFDSIEDFEGSLDALVERALAVRPRPKTSLPLINASLNALAFVLLVLGLVAIHRGQRERHALFMRAAFLASAVFLACYLYYHLVVQADAGPTPFHGKGVAKTGYLVLLASHVILAMVNLPMVLRTFWLAHKEDWERHKWWARRTFPIWLYVSITGVLVYVVLYPLNPTP